jgi:anion-transporting  ArsA/GET3 family ATPase
LPPSTRRARSTAPRHADRRVDPARRLANSLGLSRFGNDELRIDLSSLPEAKGELWAMMLDNQKTFDDLIKQIAPDPARRDAILNNRIYRATADNISGSQDYMATEKLHDVVIGGRYDLVVLDTPPSRHALDFLEAPHRLSGLVDSRAISAFLPSADSLVGRAASKVIQKILGAVFGEEFAGEFVSFLTTFTGIFRSLNVDVGEMRRFLSGPEVAFLLVSSPAPATLTEAFFFQDKTKALELPFRGFVLNRSKAGMLERAMPPARDETDPVLSAGLAKLHSMAELEQCKVDDRTCIGSAYRLACALKRAHDHVVTD